MVIAQAIKKTPQGEASLQLRQIPTFILDGNIQGIQDADTAKRIAKEVIDPFNESEVHLSVTLVSFDNGITCID
jgi:hypothetical protein